MGAETPATPRQLAIVRRLLTIQAFGEGFKIGAARNPRDRHAVALDVEIERAWRQGFEAGKLAALAATNAFAAAYDRNQGGKS